ncbi:MAG: hypothetical protein Q8J99_08805 [Sulfuritalea sp.]|nr:hypothetical protein [Sulfuritalea sp.]
MLIQTSDLSYLRGEVAATLGEDFVEEMTRVNLDGFPVTAERKRESREQHAEFARQKLIAHPLAHWLQNFDRDVQKSCALGKFHLCDTSARFLHFAGSLIDARGIENFELLIPRLRQRSEFRSAAYELDVACRYLVLGYSVRFVPTVQGRMTPDLVVTKNGLAIQVECKSSKDETDEQHNLFMQLAVRLDAAMEKIGINLFVTIIPRVHLDGQHIERLFEELAAEISKTERRQAFLGGAVTIDWREIDPSIVIARAAPEDTKTVSDRLYSSRNFELGSSYVSLTSTTGNDGIVSWTRDRGSEIRNYFEVDIYHSLRAKIRKANRQLSDDSPAIVHIEVPCQTVSLFLSMIDENIEGLQELVKAHRKVRAVVLECATIDRQLEEGGNPISNLFYVISNPAADCSIPIDLQIAGTVDMGIKVDVGQGTIAIPIAKPADPRTFYYRPLLMHSAPHGDEQVIIWVKSDNTVRFEAISATNGRKVLERNVDWTQLPDEFEVLVSWGGDHPFLRVGAPVREKLGPPEYVIRNENSRGKFEDRELS